MPRKPRFNLIGIPQHVIQHGNSREPCFYAEEDYRRYLDDMQECADKFVCRIHAYVFVTPMTEYGIPQMMQALGRRYVYYVNKTYKRTGTLWEGRYKSSLIDSDRDLLTCMRYIELNPIRANMVNHPGEYRWPSYHANAQGKDDALITSHPMYFELGVNPDIRQTAYRELFRHHMDNDILYEIRESLNHDWSSGVLISKTRLKRSRHDRLA